MEFSHPHPAHQTGTISLSKGESALRMLFTNDPGIGLQILLCIPMVVAGLILHLSILQWILVVVVTLLFLLAGIFRTASLLQIARDPEVSNFHRSRIRFMGAALVSLTAVISLVTYLFVFVPVIIPYLAAA